MYTDTFELNITGRVIGHPAVRQAPNGQPSAAFPVSVTHSWTTSEGERIVAKPVIFHVYCDERHAGTAAILRPGTRVHLQGAPDLRARVIDKVGRLLVTADTLALVPRSGPDALTFHFTGYLTDNPVYQRSASGTYVTFCKARVLTVAADGITRPRDFDIAAFGPLSGPARNLRAGDRITVETRPAITTRVVGTKAFMKVTAALLSLQHAGDDSAELAGDLIQTPYGETFSARRYAAAARRELART